MITVYGIPSCDSCRTARRWLEANGLHHEWVDLRQQPPTRATVARWADAFGVRALRNTSGASYRALPAEKAEWTDERWIDAFASDPMLIKRPVIERDGQPLMVGKKGLDALAPG